MPPLPSITFSLDFLNIILALSTIILTVILYLKSRKKKELGYILLSDTSIVGIDEEFAENIKVSYLGVPAKTFQLIRFQIINTGNVHISEEDFYKPLSFVQGKQPIKGKSRGFFLLNFPEKSDKLVKPTPYYKERVGVEPLLLNPGVFFLSNY
jgi:hypothetical protein